MPRVPRHAAWCGRGPRPGSSRRSGVARIVRARPRRPVPGNPAAPDRWFRGAVSCRHVAPVRSPRSSRCSPRPRTTLPDGDGWLFEPKWDGFRALVFRDGDEVYTQSRDLKPLDRYFPELAAPLRAQLPERCVLDGEVVIARDGALDFEALLLRIHPAASRVRMLAAEIAGVVRRLGPARARRRGPARACRRASGGPGSRRRSAGVTPPVHLTPATRDRALAADWFDRFEGAGLDGVVAKRLDGTYQPGKRAMLKIKHERTADCVVAGFRWHKNGPGTHVGSLLLGLYDDAGRAPPRRDHVVVHVGPARRAGRGAGAAPRGRARRPPVGRVGRVGGIGAADASGQRLPGRRVPLEPRQGPLVGAAPRRARRARSPTTTSRATGSGTRRRSAAGARTSPPRTCRYDQLETTAPFELARIFGDG